MRIARAFCGVSYLLALNGVAAQGVWESRAPFPVAATEVSAVALNGRMYVICGITANGSRNTLYAYDPYRDTWEERAPAPVSGGLDHCNFAAANGKLYLLGALRFGSSFIDGDTHEYDPTANRWQTVARMPTPRGASGVAVIADRIYVAGGLGGASNELDVFDTTTRQWTRLANMPSARDHLTAQVVNEKFYAIAGRNGSTLIEATEEYDPQNNTWRRRAGIPTPRGGLASAVLGGQILVLGGEGPSGTPERTYRHNESYDPATDSWRSLPDLPTPRHGLQGAAMDGRVFLAAGGPREGASFSSAHEVFFLPPTSRPRVLPDGIRNAASGVRIAAGGLVSIFGENLSNGEQAAQRFPLLVRMNATSVTVNGQGVPLLYVGPRQINFQLPFSVPPGAIQIVVDNAGVSSEPVQTQGAAEAAAIYTLDGSGAGQGAVLIAGTGLIARATRDAFSRAPRRGEVVEIYCNTLGPVDNTPGPGVPASASPISRTVGNPSVMIGGQPAEVLFSGLTPGLAGVYQINARIGMNASIGIAVPVQITAPSLSNTVTIAVVE